MKKSKDIQFEKVIYFLIQNWIWVFTIIWSILVGLPFLAPVFMKIGMIKSANIIYSMYSFLCHQLPQRSFFLFGKESMYSLEIINQVYENTLNPIILRKFIGNPELGWKVAWSDRMVSMYSMLLPVAWFWYIFKKRIKDLPVFAFIIFLLPMGIDAISHFISDFAGIGQGFRDSNFWLASLTNFQFPTSFYIGDALGSFNSWMRILTGVLFAIGGIWFSFPVLDEMFSQTSSFYKKRFDKLDSLEIAARNAIK